MMYRQKYVFSPRPSNQNLDKDGESCIYVNQNELYTPKRGYGFLTEQNTETLQLLKFPEFNGGFLPFPWYRSQTLTRIKQTAYGCMVVPPSEEKTEYFTRQIPLRFKCDVPSEGSYQIKAKIISDETISDIRIFTGRRCLAAYLRKLAPNEVYAPTLSTEVCGIIPRGEEKAYENNCIEVTVTADKPCLCELEITQDGSCPVLYIAGDSTVTDQSADYPYAPQTSYAGWGQILPYYLKSGITVSNHSHSGLTTESFRTEGHADIPMRRAKAGDYMFFQFAHNDQKLMHLKADEGYKANLEQYICDCRSIGVYPVLVTPVARNTWRGDNNIYNDLLKDYAEACVKLGKEMSVPVLDLHRLSMEFVTTLGREDAKKYFYPSDYTHHNDFGAQQMAAIVCREILRVCPDFDEGYKRLASLVTENIELWPEPSPVSLPKCPDGFVLENMTPEFEEPDRPDDILLRAEALDMVIRRAGFFITNVYNDLFTDIIGHEWYAGVVECGLQNGILTETTSILTEAASILPKAACPNHQDKKFYPLEPITLLDFIVFLMMAYKSRKSLPEVISSPYDKAANENIRPLVAAACHLGLLSEEGTDILTRHLSRKEGAAMCRKLKIM